MAPLNALKRALKDLNAAYKKSLKSYHKMKRAEASKSICLSMLDHQLTGPLLQYKFHRNKLNRDPSACLCCGHSFTMPVELQANMNAKNCKQCTKASANGGDRKFNAVSANHGCYGYLHNCRNHVAGFGCDKCERKVVNGVVAWEQGPGVCSFDCNVCTCNCRCVFQEHNRQKICIGIGREKKRIEEQGKNGSNPSPVETGAMVWTQSIMTEIQNRNVCEHQHVDGHTSHEHLHAISPLALYDVYSDLLMVLDANVTQGLQKNMPISAPLQYCCTDGTTKPMTFAQAMAAEKRWGGEVGKHQGGEVSIGNITPPAADFLCNSNNGI